MRYVRQSVASSRPWSSSVTGGLSLCESVTESLTIVRSVKFGDATPNRPDNQSGEFELKQQTAQLFEFVRSVDAGEIRVLEVRGGLPFTMEIKFASGHRGL